MANKAPDYKDGSNRPRPTQASFEGETPFQYLLRQLKEGKLEYRDGSIYSLYDNRGKGSWRKEPRRIGNYDARGYERYRFRFNGGSYSESTYRIIYAYFNEIDKIPEGMVINHLDGDRRNNRIENLELCTVKENIYHAFNTGLALREKRPGARLKWKEVDEIRDLFEKEDYTIRQLSERFDSSISAIQKVVTYKTWVRRYDCEQRQG